MHLITLLLRLRRRKASLGRLGLRAVGDLVNSSLFASCFAIIIPIFYCYSMQIIGPVSDSTPGFVASFLFSFAILFESPSRWSEMSIYVLAQWFEGFTKSLYKRKLLPVLPHWDVVSSHQKYLLGLAMAIVAYAYFDKTGEEHAKETKMDFVLGTILGSSNLKDL